MVNKRGQAAMEFLMTYGWAILVVLAAIGALAYFGVLSPDRFLPEKCTLPSGMACLDFTWDSTNGITTVIQNSAGFDMNAVGVSVNGTSCNAALTYVAGTSTSSNENATTLTDGETKTYRMAAACTGLSGKFKGDVTVDYTNQQTSLSHSKLGEIILKTG
jgi:hypothetical protein